MARTNQSKLDALAVLKAFERRGPGTEMERMALVGAKATLKRLERLEQYRERNGDRLREYARDRSTEARKRKKDVYFGPWRPAGRPRKNGKTPEGEQ